jgi:hypothetical protein
MRNASEIEQLRRIRLRRKREGKLGRPARYVLSTTMSEEKSRANVRTRRIKPTRERGTPVPYLLGA